MRGSSSCERSCNKMRILALFLPLAAVLLASSGCHEGTEVSAPSVILDAKFLGPREVLWSGPRVVDVMQTAAPPRFVELSNKMQQAIKEKPQWWLDAVANAKPGEPLPYDERLGMSEQEWEEWIQLGESMTLVKKEQATVRIKKQGEDVYVLDGGDTLPHLTGIEIDLKEDVVRTPFGVAAERSQIDAPETTLPGKWSGVQWKLEELGKSSLTGTIVKFGVGTVAATGRELLYYNVKHVTEEGLREGRPTRIRYELLYDVPDES